MKTLDRAVGVLCLAINLGLSFQVRFRSSTDVVLVDVSVLAGRQPVAGLTVGDFTVIDDGVLQQIQSVDLMSGPLDVTLLIESGRATAEIRSALNAGVQEVRSLLLPGDDLRVVTFDSQVRHAPAPGDPASRGEWGTTLFDAIVAASMTPIEPGRRQLVIALTQGLDTNSLTDRSMRRTVLSRSEAPVHIVAVATAPRAFVATAETSRGRIVDMRSHGNYDWMLSEVTDLTGGRFFDVRPGESFGKALREAITEFRTRYVLRYEPQGVSSSGWHGIQVKVTRGGRYDVRARPGYWRQPR